MEKAINKKLKDLYYSMFNEYPPLVGNHTYDDGIYAHLMSRAVYVTMAPVTLEDVNREIKNRRFKMEIN